MATPKLPSCVEVIDFDFRPVVVVDSDGNPIGTKVDGEGNLRLMVDTNLVLSGITISGVTISIPDAFKIKGSDGREIDDETANGKVALDVKAYLADALGNLLASSAEPAGRSLSVSEAGKRVRIELRYDGSPNGKDPTYVGVAPYGTLTSAASWRIEQLTYSGLNLISVRAANGSLAADQIFDNYLSLSYS